MKIKNKAILTMLVASLISMPNGYNVLASEINIDEFITTSTIPGSFPDIKATSDGGYVLTYNSDGSNGDFTTNGQKDGVIEKFNSKGQRQWIKNWGGTSDDSFLSVVETSDKGYIVIAKTSSSDILGGIDGATSSNLVGIKYSSTGEVVLTKTLEFSENIYVDEYTKLGAKKVEGGFVFFDSNYIIKYNENLEKVWTITSDSGLKYSTALELSNGNIMTVSNCNNYSYGYAAFRKYSSDSQTQLLDKSSNQSYTITKSNDELYQIYDIAELEDGSFIAVGTSDYSSGSLGGENRGGDDAVISKISSEGTIEKSVTFGTDRWDNARSITKTKDNGFIVLSQFNDDSNLHLTKFNADLSVEWDKDFGLKSMYENATCGEVITLKNGTVVAVVVDDSDNISTITYSDIKTDEILEAVEAVEANPTEEGLINARLLVNGMPEGPEKAAYQARLNDIFPSTTFTKQSASANVDIYIKSENMLSLSLSTNSITFEDFGGTENLVKENAVILTVNSSLPYKVNASLATEIQNAAKDKTMDKEILNIKANGELDSAYQHFTAINTPTEIIETQEAGNGKTHGIDIMLKGGIPHEKDIYKTTIKFEATQH